MSTIKVKLVKWMPLIIGNWIFAAVLVIGAHYEDTIPICLTIVAGTLYLCLSTMKKRGDYPVNQSADGKGN